MKIQLNNNEKLIIQTPFGELELSVNQFGATLMYQNDNLKHTGSTGNTIETKNGETYHLSTVLKDSSYNKIQIAVPIENDIKSDRFLFFLHEGRNARSELIEINDFLEYWNFDQIEEINEYDQIEEYLHENGIFLEDDCLDDIKEYYTVTNFK